MRSKKEKITTAVAKASSKSLAGTAWPVFEDHEVERGDGDVFVYAPFRAPSLNLDTGLPEDKGLKRYYAPLRDYPDLFLEFASLVSLGPLTEDEALEHMLEWVKDYGVLGLAGVDYIEAPSRLVRQRGHSVHQQGRRESLRFFWHEVRTAAEVLELFEAATAPGGPGKRLTEALTRWHYPTDGLSLEKQREFALERAGDVVGKRLITDCYPKLYQEISGGRGEIWGGKTVGYAQGWGFRSLLGAMYLEMMWLMIEVMNESGNARRCERPGCPNIITFDPPQTPMSHPEGARARSKYRTRKDKKYCSKACSQWVYDQEKKARSS